MCKDNLYCTYKQKKINQYRETMTAVNSRPPVFQRFVWLPVADISLPDTFGLQASESAIVGYNLPEGPHKPAGGWQAEGYGSTCLNSGRHTFKVGF